jgi:hypothetical protein
MCLIKNIYNLDYRKTSKMNNTFKVIDWYVYSDTILRKLIPAGFELIP